MKLAAKITTVLVLSILLLLVVAEFITLQHENDQMQRDMEVDMRKLGVTITEIVRQFEATGRNRAPRRIIRHINGINNVGLLRSFSWTMKGWNCPSVPRRLLTFSEDVMSLPYPDASGTPHLYTYVRYSSVTSRPAALELSEPIEHTRRNNYYFAIHALTLMGATTLLGGGPRGRLGSCLGRATIATVNRQNTAHRQRRLVWPDHDGPSRRIR